MRSNYINRKWNQKLLKLRTTRKSVVQSSLKYNVELEKSKRTSAVLVQGLRDPRNQPNSIQNQNQTVTNTNLNFDSLVTSSSTVPLNSDRSTLTQNENLLNGTGAITSVNEQNWNPNRLGIKHSTTTTGISSNLTVTHNYMRWFSTYENRKTFAIAMFGMGWILPFLMAILTVQEVE